jgi:hypothetical protein
MVRVDSAYEGATMTPPKNPAFQLDEATPEVIFICPACSAKLDDYLRGYQISLPVRCADCGTLSKVPDWFWDSVRGT